MKLPILVQNTRSTQSSGSNSFRCSVWHPLRLLRTPNQHLFPISDSLLEVIDTFQLQDTEYQWAATSLQSKCGISPLQSDTLVHFQSYNLRNTSRNGCDLYPTTFPATLARQLQHTKACMKTVGLMSPHLGWEVFCDKICRPAWCMKHTH